MRACTSPNSLANLLQESPASVLQKTSPLTPLASRKSGSAACCKDAVRRQFRQRLAEVEIIGELGAKLRFACTNSRTKTAARPHFLAQGPDQRGILGKTLNEDRAGAFECGSRITHPLTRFDVSASHPVWTLVRPREKRVCQGLEARFARDLSFRPPFRPIRQI